MTLVRCDLDRVVLLDESGALTFFSSSKTSFTADDSAVVDFGEYNN